jgi:hypothetical protein
MAKYGKQKGGNILDTMVAVGVGAYAAKTSSSFSGLLWKLAQYTLILIAILLAVWVVLRVFRVSTETFVPIAPSAEGDKKTVTPAGNVIMY